MDKNSNTNTRKVQRNSQKIVLLKQVEDADAEDKKTKLIRLYEKHFGNITLACKEAKISRQLFYYYKKTDVNFENALNQIKLDDLIVDLAEEALIRLIKKGNVAAILFVLKTKGKSRGYSQDFIFEQSSNKIDFSVLSQEELETLHKIREKLLQTSAL